MKESTINISGRAMLAGVHFSIWTARKYDRKATDEVAATHGTNSNVGRYRKKLIPVGAGEYEAVASLAGEIRDFHYAQTLPWSDTGKRMLPTTNYMPYADKMRDFSARWETAVARFLDAYPAMKLAAKAALNGLYNEADYPSVADMADKFDLSIEYDAIQQNGDFRMDLPKEVLEQLEAEKAEQVRAAADAAMGDTWQRLHKTVSHIYERLSKPDADFRPTMIKNAKELCDILPRLNIYGDPRLDELTEQVRSQLTTIDDDTLKTNASVRAEVAAAAEDIMQTMMGIYGGAQ